MKFSEILLLAGTLIAGAVLAADNAVWFHKPERQVPLRMRPSACEFPQSATKCRLEHIGIVVSLPGHA